MKKIFTTVTVVCLLSLMTILGHAKAGQEYIRWANGEFDVPSEIKEANSISELQPFLSGKDEFKRMTAVRRLGEVEGIKSVSLLREIFTKEPNTMGIDDFPLVKLEVIRTLEQVGGEDAKSTLLSLLESNWERGPQVEDKKNFRLDRDFEPVVSLLLETPYNWKDNNDVFQTAQNIALSEDLRSYYADSRIATNAWKLYLKGHIPRQGVKSEKDSAKYLLNFIEDLRKEGTAYGTLGAAKKRAALCLFEKHSKEVLSSLQKELEEEFTKVPSEPNDFFKERHNRLRAQISYIEKVLREKAEDEQNNK